MIRIGIRSRRKFPPVCRGFAGTPSRRGASRTPACLGQRQDRRRQSRVFSRADADGFGGYLSGDVSIVVQLGQPHLVHRAEPFAADFCRRTQPRELPALAGGVCQESTALYRQQVLVAFGEVENSLSGHSSFRRPGGGAATRRHQRPPRGGTGDRPLSFRHRRLHRSGGREPRRAYRRTRQRPACRPALDCQRSTHQGAWRRLERTTTCGRRSFCQFSTISRKPKIKMTMPTV